jgi:Arc/MetJ-type ribon-helix-helix transcriptional regulator
MSEEYIRITVQMTAKEVAAVDKAVAIDAAEAHGRRSSRSEIVRRGALRYAEEMVKEAAQKKEQRK